jgi:hypothetical protein
MTAEMARISASLSTPASVVAQRTAMSGPDYVEVERKAHELAQTHGRTAYVYAEKQSKRALAVGETNEYTFWKAVAASLRPR